jgi:glycosyltransferase involved in cell wall biosynthesis
LNLKPLIIVSNTVGTAADFQAYQQAVKADRYPRQDYHELASCLEATLIAPDSRRLALLRLSWRLERRLKFHLAEAMRVARKLSDNQVVISTSEKVGLPLATVLGMRRQSAPHLLIAHKLSSPWKNRFFKIWPLPDHVQQVVCVSETQAEFAVAQLGLPASRVHFVYDKVDHLFFRPLETAVSGDYVLAVGQEKRDYATLLKALTGTDLRLIILNSSSWTDQRQPLNGLTPSQAEIVSRLSPRQLRDLYAGARLVVLPLFDTDYAAGVNTALETMAMARPLVISQTRGMSAYVRPGETAVAVPPGDAAALREAILSLWHDNRSRQQLGQNGRQLVTEQMTMQHYLEHLCGIVRQMQEDPLTTGSY